MREILKLMRVQQWVKNLFVFMPLFFDHKFTDVGKLMLTLLCAIAFSLAASAVYCLNDILDREADARHPEKCHRPIASGALSVTTGWIVMAVCALLAIGITICLLSQMSLWVLLIYLVLNVAYSLWLKHVSLIDVLTVAFFYVLRVVAGAVAGDVEPSQWIVVMTFLLALFLVLGKRRDDVMLQAASGQEVRRGVANYNMEYINMALTMVATITVVAYMMYSMSSEVMERFGSRYTFITAAFVLAGMLRYMQLVMSGKSGSPTRVLLRDTFIQLCVLGWIITFIVIIYL
ncbi:MAG: decaprenyl-phosphate phosphoribosyltransferase [Muribaculaceae bacterium]|nr:decaprenyl-phosphate phosphoribosyltransferase [Muribaculaceae bacterium]